jgi:hypothetical protein
MHRQQNRLKYKEKELQECTFKPRILDPHTSDADGGGDALNGSSYNGVQSTGASMRTHGAGGSGSPPRSRAGMSNEKWRQGAAAQAHMEAHVVRAREEGEGEEEGEEGGGTSKNVAHPGHGHGLRGYLSSGADVSLSATQTAAADEAEVVALEVAAEAAAASTAAAKSAKPSAKKGSGAGDAAARLKALLKGPGGFKGPGGVAGNASPSPRTKAKAAVAQYKSEAAGNGGGGEGGGRGFDVQQG